MITLKNAEVLKAVAASLRPFGAFGRRRVFKITLFRAQNLRFLRLRIDGFRPQAEGSIKGFNLSKLGCRN